MILKEAALRFIFNRYMNWRLDKLSDSKFIELEYGVDPKPRWGYEMPPHPELLTIFEQGRPAYRQWLARILEHRQRFFALEQSPPSAREATFQNSYFNGLDAAALYTILGAERPRLYIEVGSGNSTRFARRTIQDHGLPTRVVSIDPHPRVEVEALCDQSIRCPLENADPQIFEQLGPGDVLFIDGSHRCFQNSDATVFFLETLPRLRAGVIVHIHDIFLPFDYPPNWAVRYYSEQYLLACCLLANPKRMELMLSNVFVSVDRELSEQIAPLWDDARFSEPKAFATNVMKQFKGQSFWARLREA